VARITVEEPLNGTVVILTLFRLTRSSASLMAHNDPPHGRHRRASALLRHAPRNAAWFHGESLLGSLVSRTGSAVPLHNIEP
jgi:hypothetical protein